MFWDFGCFFSVLLFRSILKPAPFTSRRISVVDSLWVAGWSSTEDDFVEVASYLFGPCSVVVGFMAAVTSRFAEALGHGHFSPL